MKPSSLSRRTVVAAAAALLVPSGLRAQAPSTLAKIRSARVMTVGNSGSFPPFESIEDGKLVGFDRDLGDELGKRMGVRVEWQVMEFAGLIAALTSGRVDTLITAMTVTPDRAARIAFSTPYYKSGVAAAYRPDARILQPSDLTGKVIAVQTGTSGEKFIRADYADKVKEIRNYPDFALAMRDLEVGRVAAFVNTYPVLRYGLTKANRAGLKVSEIWDALDVGINTRLPDTDLMAEINRHLAAMQAEGFVGNLDTKWFGAR